MEHAIFSLHQSLPSQTVVKVNKLMPEDIAEYPYLDSNMAFITVIHGNKFTAPVFVVVNKDGTKIVHDKYPTYILAKQLRWAISSYLEDYGIFIGIDDSSLRCCKVFFDYNNFQWHARFATKNGLHVVTRNVASEMEMKDWVISQLKPDTYYFV